MVETGRAWSKNQQAGPKGEWARLINLCPCVGLVQICLWILQHHLSFKNFTERSAVISDSDVTTYVWNVNIITQDGSGDVLYKIGIAVM